MRVVLALLFGLCCCVLLSQEPKEDPIKEFLEKVQENYYYPQDFGLKDLKANVVFETDAEGMLEKVEATLYWKSPDKLKFEFDWDIPGILIKTIISDIKPLVEELVIPKKPLEEYQKKGTWKYELKKKDQWILTKTPLDRKAYPVGVRQRKQFYDKDYLLVKEIITGGKIFDKDTRSDIKYITKEGKKLPSELNRKFKIRTEGSDRPVVEGSLKLSYKQIDNIWLLEKLTIEMETKARGQTIRSITATMTIEDHKVNKGIDDKIFEEEPKLKKRRNQREK